MRYWARESGKTLISAVWLWNSAAHDSDYGRIFRNRQVQTHDAPEDGLELSPLKK